MGPHVYHEGFSLGENLAEAFNFGTKKWMDFIGDYPHCGCDQGLCEIDLSEFMKDQSHSEVSSRLRKRPNISYNEDMVKLENIYRKSEAINQYKISKRRHQGEPFKGIGKLLRIERQRKYKAKMKTFKKPS